MRARPRVEAAAPRPASATEQVRPAAHSAVRSAQPGDALLELQRGQGNRHVQQVVQNRLLVGPAEDRHERDADRVARQATASGAGPAASVERADRSPTVQRMPAGAGPAGASAPAGRSGDTPAGRSAVTPAGPEGGVAPPAVAAAVRRGRAEGGRPVPPGVRDRTAAVTGASFDHVRIHTGPQSDRLTEALGSRAFTVGADVFVRRSEYRPGSARGDQLLAHELTHTVQQGPPVVRRAIEAADQPEATTAELDERALDRIAAVLTGALGNESTPDLSVALSGGQLLVGGKAFSEAAKTRAEEALTAYFETRQEGAAAVPTVVWVGGRSQHAETRILGGPGRNRGAKPRQVSANDFGLPGTSQISTRGTH